MKKKKKNMWLRMTALAVSAVAVAGMFIGCDSGEANGGDGAECMHEYETSVVAPTCAERGYTEYVCKDCGYRFEDNYVDAVEHTYGEWQVVTEPGCEVNGEKQRECTGCGETQKREIPLVGHAYEEVVTDATCTEPGSIERTCSACGYHQLLEIEAVGHEWSEWEVVVEATTETIGLRVHHCGRCGVEEEGEIPVLPEPDHVHDYQIQVVEATCELGGYTLHTCLGCGDTYASNLGKPLGHDYRGVVTAPTCTEQGYTTYACHCGASYVKDYTDPRGHVWGEWGVVVEPTVEEEGRRERACYECGEVEYEAIDKLPPHVHDYATTVVAPTCTTDGYTMYACECGESYRGDPVRAKGHDYKEEVTEATCTTDGFTVYTCNVCGDSYTDDYVYAKGHDHKAVVTEATCTQQGYTTYTCFCGDTYKNNYMNAKGHQYQGVVTEATCTTSGHTVYTCSACGDSYTGNYVSAKGHSYGDWVIETEPGCTSVGTQKKTCNGCGDVKTEFIAATGHSYRETVKEATCTQAGSITKTCQGCGNTMTETVAAKGHSYGDWVGKPGTSCETGGEETRTCSGCGDTETRTVESSHRWSAWVITKAATRTTPGERKHTCEVCGVTETEKVKKCDSCDWVTTVVPPTCGANGYTLKACSVCGYNVKSNYTSIEGQEDHSWSEWVTTVEPTTTSLGEKERVCSACGEKQTYALPMLEESGKPYESYIDPAIKVTESIDYTGYEYGKVQIDDRRTWGDAPSIWVNDDGSLQLVYYNAEGERIEVHVEVPREGHTMSCTILDDGTYKLNSFGSLW